MTPLQFMKICPIKKLNTSDLEDEVEDEGGEVAEPAGPQHPRRDPGGDSDGNAAALHKLFSRDGHVYVLHQQSRPDCQAGINKNVELCCFQILQNSYQRFTATMTKLYTHCLQNFDLLFNSIDFG